MWTAGGPREQLLRLANTFCEAEGISLSTLADRMLRDQAAFRRLAEGRGMEIKTWEKAMRWLSARWSRRVAWPWDIPRPPPVELHALQLQGEQAGRVHEAARSGDVPAPTASVRLRTDAA